jgi:hypothetical protein
MELCSQNCNGWCVSLEYVGSRVRKYWYNCNQSCDGCLSDTCDKGDGNCTDKSGCKPEWIGILLYLLEQWHNLVSQSNKWYIINE